MKQAMGDTRRGLLPEDLLRFRWVDEIVLDPTGQAVAYTVKAPDVASNGYTIHAYVHRLDEPAAHRLSHGNGRASSLAWSRDGRLAYTWSADEGHSVRVWGSNGEKSFPLDGEPLGSLDWSPDGRRLVGVRWTPQRATTDRGPRPGIPAPTIRVVRRLRYKQDGTGWVHDRFSQVWVLELVSGDLVQLTSSECDYSEPKWSDRGDRLAFIGLAREQNIEPGQGQIWICDYPDGALRLLLPDWRGACRSPVWGDDDRHIAFAGHEQPAPVNRRIFMTPYLSDVERGTARALAPDLDQEVGNYAVSDSRKGLSNITVKWAPGDAWIYFLLTERGATNLYRIDTAGRTERIVHGSSVTFEFSPAAGDRAAYGQADPANPGEVYLWESGQTRRLTALNPWLRDHLLSLPEEYEYEGVDGAKVHAWTMQPPGMVDGQRYPTVVYVHCSMFSWDFSHEFQCIVNAGFVLAYFNQRGTTAGYGQAWTRASEGDQGGRDYEEIMLGVDKLVSRPYVDDSRLGVTGGSCGGFMTNWIVGHTDRFRAAVTQRSIVNQISFFGTADIGPECTQGETGANPWAPGGLEATWRQSPLAYAANIHTPLLILHSDEDHRCPLEQAEQLFAALRWLGREVELVVFQGENHGLSRGGRPGNRIERLRRIVGWFERHLGTSPVAAETSRLNVYSKGDD
jgi:dipeptidyl aminopeptidase/acylaminoacyl peptidase